LTDFKAELRHRCRNPHCRSKLPEPVENKHHAFCIAGCYQQFYRRRCVVCERELKPGPANRRLCKRSSCKAEFRRFPHLYSRDPILGSKPVKRPLKTSIKPGTFFGQARGIRGPKWVLDIECAGFLVDAPEPTQAGPVVRVAALPT
jgi:hypothetical protein